MREQAKTMAASLSRIIDSPCHSSSLEILARHGVTTASDVQANQFSHIETDSEIVNVEYSSIRTRERGSIKAFDSVELGYGSTLIEPTWW